MRGGLVPGAGAHGPARLCRRLRRHLCAGQPTGLLPLHCCALRHLWPRVRACLGLPFSRAVPLSTHPAGEAHAHGCADDAGRAAAAPRGTRRRRPEPGHCPGRRHAGSSGRLGGALQWPHGPGKQRALHVSAQAVPAPQLHAVEGSPSHPFISLSTCRAARRTRWPRCRPGRRPSWRPCRCCAPPRRRRCSTCAPSSRKSTRTACASCRCRAPRRKGARGPGGSGSCITSCHARAAIR